MPTKIQPLPNGPLKVEGDLKISLPDGKVLEQTEAYFCRCGHSGNKPFCDGSHKEKGFKAS